MSESRRVRVEPAGHPRVEAFLARHEDVVTLAEARWMRAQRFAHEPSDANVRELWMHLQLVFDGCETALDETALDEAALDEPALDEPMSGGSPPAGPPSESPTAPPSEPLRAAPGHPMVERFVREHAHCVTVAQASRLRRLNFPADAPVSMELLTGLWALLHYETLLRDKCVQGAEPARELLEQMLQQVIGDAALGVAGQG